MVPAGATVHTAGTAAPLLKERAVDGVEIGGARARSDELFDCVKIGAGSGGSLSAKMADDHEAAQLWGAGDDGGASELVTLLAGDGAPLALLTGLGGGL
jgi:hypothetical protein